MNKSRSSSFRASAAAAVALIAGSFLATSALATTMNPQPISPGMSSVGVPVYGSGASNFQTSPTGTGLAYCTSGGCAMGSLTLNQIGAALDGGFVEIAGTTNLNPFGSDDLTLAIVLGLDKPVASVELPGFSTWSTDLQACSPNLAIPCASTNSGANAARDSAGNITLLATSMTGLPTQDVDGLIITDVYAIYTNAPVSDLVDPLLTVTFSDGSPAETFSALSLMAPASTGTVPEPSALALLAAGLAALWLGMGLRRRSK